MRTPPLGVITSMMASETSEAYLVLLTLDDGINPPYLFTSDSVDTVIGGTTTYVSYPFDITLPNNVEDQISTAQLSVTNVDRRLIESVRSLATPMNVSIQVVVSSNHDVMVSYTDFKWRQLTYDANVVSGTLTLEDFLAEPVGHLMTGTNFPGLFFT